MVAFRSSSYVTKVGGSRTTGNRAEVYLSEWYDLIKVLNEFDKDLLKQFRRDARAIGKPVQYEIRKGIPSTAPISGMRRRIIPGRVTWGTGKPAKSALIKVRNPRKFSRSERTPILSIAVGSPGTIIADMAGKGKITGKAKITPVYAYSRAKSGFRRHRINGQGEIMIQSLNAALGPGSRMVWPSAEKALPAAREEFEASTHDVVRQINRKLEQVDGL